MREAWIIDAARTPRGRGKAGKGSLSEIHPQELLAQVLKALVRRTGVDPRLIDDVVVGCVSQVGEQGACVARNAVLAAGLPVEVPGVSVNRFCASGAQAVNFAVLGVLSGQQDLVIGGGVESMSRVPIGADGGGMDGNNAVLRNTWFQVPQGISADLIATREGFKRADVDAFALQSQKRTAAAQAEQRFNKSLIAVTDPVTGAVKLERDEFPRAETTLETLAQLPAAFEAMGKTPAGPSGETLDQLALRQVSETSAVDHVHTAGNSSGIVDGAAGVMVASSDFAKAHGLKPRARIKSVAAQGSDPILMLTAPAPTSVKALAKLGMKPKDVDLWEINEAFAAIPLQTVRTLGIEMDRVNVNGGAIALGHPLGATGAILIGTVLDELERQNKAVGLVTLCIGGGMGVATVIERM